MSNDKKHVWKDYFESRMNGNYSKTHKDILKIVDKKIRNVYPDIYPNIQFDWSAISILYEQSKNDYLISKPFKDNDNYNTITYSMADVMSSLRHYSFIPHSCIELDIIQWNKDKDCVFVKLMDGRSTVVKRYGDTKDDIYAAVAYALAKIEFETNSNFKKEVDSCLVILDSKKGKKNGK